jgi:hypothetical protein
MNDRVVGLSVPGKILGRQPMKTLLAGIALAIGMIFTSQAFALPYCPNSIWQQGHYVCANFDE